MFGSSVIGRGVESCLRAGGGRLVTEEVWMAWAGREPPELVWLTTAYRQAAATQVHKRLKESLKPNITLPHRYDTACDALPVNDLLWRVFATSACSASSTTSARTASSLDVPPRDISLSTQCRSTATLLPDVKRLERSLLRLPTSSVQERPIQKLRGR